MLNDTGRAAKRNPGARKNRNGRWLISTLPRLPCLGEAQVPARQVFSLQTPGLKLGVILGPRIADEVGVTGGD